MKVKEESKKVGLTLNIQKMKIMAPGPITLWEIDGETVDTIKLYNFISEYFKGQLNLKNFFPFKKILLTS